MRIAWFSPLPPMASGIADYTTELVPYFAEAAEVDVFCPRPGRLRRARVPRGSRVREPGDDERLVHGYDATFYHLGNNPFHEFVYEAAIRRPGIAVFHDAVLHHLVAYMTVEHRRDFARYDSILREELGDLGGRLARLRWNGVATDLEKFLFPLTGHVARRSLGVVVHSKDAAARMRETAPEVPLEIVPHHAGEPPASVAGVDRTEARRRLRLSPDAFLVGHFGFVTKPKQPAAVVSGFARLHEEVPEARLLMVGADRSGGALARLEAELGVGDAVRHTGFVDLQRFYLYLRAVDVVVNLRYPSAGESSGTLARSLAEGRAVIVNNYGSWAELSPDVALKVEIDGPQGEQVGRHLLHLARDQEFRRRIEQGAAGYARENLDPARCRDRYLAFARRVTQERATAPA